MPLESVWKDLNQNRLMKSKIIISQLVTKTRVNKVCIVENLQLSYKINTFRLVI